MSKSTLAVTVVSVFVLLLSIYSKFNYGIDPKHCDGTYIYPGYSLLDFKSSNPALNRRYQLYKHHEAGRDVRGIPVLFIPGNAGNYTQVKSLGSVAYRLWLKRNQSDHPLDLYTMNTKGELAAFHSNLLEDQAFYANEAIQYILESYPKNIQPESVIILGHSMGGIVARSIPKLKNYQPGTIKDIFTLSSPHKEAPIPITRSIVKLYRNLNTFWRQEHRDGGGLENITFVSIAGGSRDTILDSDTTYINSFADPSRSYHGISTGIPHVWTSGDHEGAVWCDQILQKIVSGAFEVSKKPNASVNERMALLNHLYVGPKAPLPLPKFGDVKIHLRNLRVLLNENYVELPTLTTAEYEDRYIRITLPPYETRHMYELHLISNIESLNVLGCAKETVDSELQCKAINGYINPLPVPDKGDFKIVFRDPMNMKTPNRSFWVSLDMSVGGHDELDTIVFHVPPQKSGFLYADIRFPQKRVENDLTTRAGLTITPSSVKTNVKFLPIKDPIVKYKLKIQRLKGKSAVTGLDHQIPTNFPMLVMQKIANESRPISLVNNQVVFFYVDRNHELNNGLEFDIWSDPHTDPYEFLLQVDVLGSLSAFTTFFKTIWVSLGFCSVLLSFTSDKLESPYETLNAHMNIRLSAVMLAISAIHSVFGGMMSDALNGNRDLIFIPLYTVQFYLSSGLVNGIFLVVYKLVEVAGRNSLISHVTINSPYFKLGFIVLLMFLQLVLSTTLLLPFVLFHSFMVCAISLGKYKTKVIKS
ncbi:GPI inositol-deacylase [Boothiomyces macroporosus]|uniref:GPI inositol-deacylase n=1 Tax=Boothiomyces macroporosus TaxID=261099 RepID=A0AAD5Y803_9FUNG|nr:GPI inositol-deacylase [Boothiomyces macroporosus]